MDLEQLAYPRHAALICVDIQNDFSDSNGALARPRAGRGAPLFTLGRQAVHKPVAANT